MDFCHKLLAYAHARVKNEMKKIAPERGFFLSNLQDPVPGVVKEHDLRGLYARVFANTG